MNGHAPAVALNERAQEAMPEQPQFHRALNDDMLVEVLQQIALRLSYGHLWATLTIPPAERRIFDCLINIFPMVSSNGILPIATRQALPCTIRLLPILIRTRIFGDGTGQCCRVGRQCITGNPLRS
jgi:hypothetical protein